MNEEYHKDYGLAYLLSHIDDYYKDTPTFQKNSIFKTCDIILINDKIQVTSLVFDLKFLIFGIDTKDRVLYYSDQETYNVKLPQSIIDFFKLRFT